MKVDTTEYLVNRDKFHRLYQSLRHENISHQDILMMVGNPYAETIRQWKYIPESRRQIIRKEYPEIDVATAAYLKWEAEHVRISNINEGVDDCFADFVGFVTNVKSFQLGYKAWQAFKSRKIVTTILNNVPKLEKSELIKVNKAKGDRAEMRTQKVLGKDAIHDKYSYKNGKIVDRGTKDSQRPDFIKGKTAIEVKNHDINKNSAGLIRSVVDQIKKRAVHLPKGYEQRVMIDITEQKVTKEAFQKVVKKIVEKCDGIISENDIRWIGDFVG